MNRGRAKMVDVSAKDESERVAVAKDPRVVTVAGPEHFVYASDSGVWEPCVELGQEVKAGQLAARKGRLMGSVAQ